MAVAIRDYHKKKGHGAYSRWKHNVKHNMAQKTRVGNKTMLDDGGGQKQ